MTTIPEPRQAYGRAVYEVPLDTGHLVSITFTMPMHHRVSYGESVRPTAVSVTRPTHKTCHIGKAAQLKIDEVVAQVVEAEARKMALEGIKPISHHDLARYRREYGSIDLDRLLQALKLEAEYGATMESAWEISGNYVTRDLHEEKTEGFNEEIRKLKQERDDAVEAQPSESEAAHAERITEALADLKLHGATLLTHRPGATVLDQLFDYLESA